MPCLGGCLHGPEWSPEPKQALEPEDRSLDLPAERAAERPHAAGPSLWEEGRNVEGLVAQLVQLQLVPCWVQVPHQTGQAALWEPILDG